MFFMLRGRVGWVRWRTVCYVLKGKSGVGEDCEAAHSESSTPV